MSCNEQDLQTAQKDEAYYAERYRLALGGKSKIDPNDALYGVRDPVADIRPAGQELDSLQIAMQTRENEVENCVNDLVSYSNLQNAQTQTANGATSALTVARNQQIDAETNFNNMMSARDSKARMIEINTYYSKQYAAYTDIFKVIFAFCIPLVILGMLNKEDIVDDGTYFRFSILIIIVAFLMCAYRINDMYWRNNINYDNYDWLYNSSNKDGKWQYNRSLEENTGILLGAGGNSTCQGSACCDTATFWDGQRCKVNPSHKFIGKYHYCVDRKKYNAEFIPTSNLNGIITGAQINGTFTVTSDNPSTTATITQDLHQGELVANQRSYTATTTTTTGITTITFSRIGGESVNTESPTHLINGLPSASTGWTSDKDGSC